ncbi:polysaccharide biosynthesis tyrosine autokinase [Geodermatophilus sp. SYSU D00696]
MDLRQVLAAVRAAWWLPVIGLVVGAAAALGASLLQTPLYTSYTQLFVSTTDSRSTSDVFQGGQFSQQRVGSYAELLTGEELAARVVERLGVEDTPTEMSDRITATAVADTVLIDVAVEDPSPAQARDIAEAVGAEFPGLVAELETPDDGAASPVRVTVTDRPEVAESPTSPKTWRDTVLGALVGLLIGVALALLRTRLDRSVKDTEQAAELVGAPVIGVVFRDETLNKRHVFDRQSTNRTAEDYRQLRTNLRFLKVDEPPKVIMVSSALPAEGKTTAVVNLALALTDAGHSVTIVEADLRRPKVTEYLGLVGDVGLTNVLAGSADLDDVIQQYGEEPLSVVAAGPTPPNPGELLASSQMAALVDKLRGKSEYVLFDAPPLLPVADSSGLAVHMDGVLLSVRHGTTRKEQVQQAAAALDRVRATKLGVILNIVPPTPGLVSDYGYMHTYGTAAKHRGPRDNSPRHG